MGQTDGRIALFQNAPWGAGIQTVKFNKSVLSFLRQLTTWHCPHLLLRAVLLRGGDYRGDGGTRPPTFWF